MNKACIKVKLMCWTNEYPQPAGLEIHISSQLVVWTFDTDFITYCRLCFSFQGLSSLLSKNSGFQVKYDSDNSFYGLKNEIHYIFFMKSNILIFILVSESFIIKFRFILKMYFHSTWYEEEFWNNS